MKAPSILPILKEDSKGEYVWGEWANPLIPLALETFGRQYVTINSFYPGAVGFYMPKHAKNPKPYSVVTHPSPGTPDVDSLKERAEQIIKASGVHITSMKEMMLATRFYGTFRGSSSNLYFSEPLAVKIGSYLVPSNDDMGISTSLREALTSAMKISPNTTTIFVSEVIFTPEGLPLMLKIDTDKWVRATLKSASELTAGLT